jgi:hypothetical protein
LKILDAHAHIGSCRVFDLDVTEEQLIKNMNEKGVDAAIVQPFPGAFPQPPVQVHDRIAKLSEQNPGRVFGLASVNPHVMPPETWRGEIERCIKDLGFVGIKMHPAGHALFPASKDGMMVFEEANRLGVPVLVHTGLGIPAALPGMVIPAARKFENLKIVLGHCGFNIATGEAVFVASAFKNVYVECSWSMGPDIAWAIDELGPERVMLGTDLPGNIQTELVKAKEAGITGDKLEWYYGKTAQMVFNVKL